MNRRKIKRYRNSRRNSGMKFVGIVGIMVAAVICGYLTARFVIAPLLGYDTEVLKLDFPTKLTSLLDRDEREASVPETAEADSDASDSEEEQDSKAEKGYALQFGVFSTRERAEELADKLSAEGISAKIKEDGDKFKVVSPLIETKEDAVEQLKNTKTSHVSGIFIAVVK